MRYSVSKFIEIFKMGARANFVRALPAHFKSNQAKFVYASRSSMHIQLCKVSIPEILRSLHNIASNLIKIMKNAIFCHFIDLRPYKFVTFKLAA